MSITMLASLAAPGGGVYREPRRARMFGTIGCRFTGAKRPRAGGAARAGRSLRATLIGVSAAGALAATAPAALGAVTVSPLPGTTDANPATQISILGTPAANIESVTVTGTSSGVHSGHLASFASASGASFVLDEPLQEGEEVDT